MEYEKLVIEKIFNNSALKGLKPEHIDSIKHKTRSKTCRLIKSGTIKKPDKCEVCGSQEKLQAHHWHWYYMSRAADVLWLCQQCHSWHNNCVKHNYEGTYTKVKVLSY